MSRVIATQRKFLSRQDDEIVVESKQEVEREDDQFREMEVKCRVLHGTAGSAFVEIGNTKVMCSINGPKEQGGDSVHDGSLNVSLYGMDPTNSIRYTITSALNAVVCLKKFSRAKIDVELNVMSDDGGVLAACVMAAGVALISANIECFDLVLACSLLVCDGGNRMILDPTLNQLKEYKSSGVSITVAIMPALGQVVCFDVDGLIKKGVLDKVIRYGSRKCLEIYPMVSERLRSEAGNLF